MKKIVFISDNFKRDYAGGGESNDDNLINYLNSRCNLIKKHSRDIKIEDIASCESVLVSNFISLGDREKLYIQQNSDYVIYEHDHKYVTTRDPSKFYSFQAPANKIVNKAFYENANCVVVLSEICKEVLFKEYKER